MTWQKLHQDCLRNKQNTQIIRPGQVSPKDKIVTVICVPCYTVTSVAVMQPTVLEFCINIITSNTARHSNLKNKNNLFLAVPDSSLNYNCHRQQKKLWLSACRNPPPPPTENDMLKYLPPYSFFILNIYSKYIIWVYGLLSNQQAIKQLSVL